MKITNNHNGKMEGLASLNTACWMNEQCKKNQCVKGSICEKCFSNSMANMYGWKGSNNCFEQNTKELTSHILTIEEIKSLKINSVFFRFEAFGDLNNVTQAINYLNICNAYPYTHFAIWTKNPSIMDKAIKEIGKPSNLKILVSSLFMNIPSQYKADWIDHIFTVYTFDYLKEHTEIAINCGARSCFECHKCYTNDNNSPYYINEVLKADSKKYYKWLTTL